MKFVLFSFFFIFLILEICDANKFLLITESAQANLNGKFVENFGILQQSNGGIAIDAETISFSRKLSEDVYKTMCDRLARGGIAAVVDMAWGGWIRGRKAAADMGIPYIRIETANHPFVRAADDFLRSLEAVDAALIFETQSQLDQSLYYIIGNSFLRIVAARLDDPDAFPRLKKMRPRPSNYVAWGSTSSLIGAYEKARTLDMLKRDTKWTLVFEDFKSSTFDVTKLTENTNFLQLNDRSCCAIKNVMNDTCNCQDMKLISEIVVSNAGKMLGESLISLQRDGKLYSGTWTCVNTTSGNANVNTQIRKDFETYVERTVNASKYSASRDKNGVFYISASLDIDISIRNKSSSRVNVGTWKTNKGFEKAPNYNQTKIKPFYRVGVVLGLPWAWIEGAPDPINITYLDDTKINRGLTGYCIDLLVKLSTLMDFDYEIVPSSRNQYGFKMENGSWTGIVGDLISGEIDISVATLTMTTEREEVIDFVAPYFDQSGISILLRKKEPEQSIFKFMSVLKWEVWLGILGAVIVVSLLIWILDRFSPYSYCNNKEAYPEGARDFTLGESIWFALTSLTPQGGGECPKALSGRILVAAYWLFIVLMLATFTANLAAFLTVERMQTTVQNLEELARQSRINYTVVKGSPYEEYFKNMAGAEEELYRKWKEITMNSSSDQSKYRVWDYPIREQYTHVLKMIQQTGTLMSPEEGYRKVDESLKGEYAFIHDAAEIRYMYYQNCNFTEVGEPFAEQPLAVAVQQGSHLVKLISKTILELQKERYFEQLTTTYWNSTKRNNCPVLDDSQGITLRSLGGIFLATLVGLALSMITLAYEVWQQKRQEKNQVENSVEPLEDKGQILVVGSKQIPIGGKSGLEIYRMGDYGLDQNLPPVTGRK